MALAPSSEKAMAPHSSTLAWKIPWMEESGGLQSMGLLRVGHNWATSLSLFHFHALEKEMAPHSSVLVWRIPGTGEPGRLPSMGSHRVGHDWSDLAAAAWPCNPTPGHISAKKHNPKVYLHPNIHCSTVYKSQGIKAAKMSIDRGMDKEDMVCVYSGLLLSP